MAKKEKKMSKEENNLLWHGVTEEDFLNEGDSIYDEEISEYDKKEMTFFMQNSNLLRHLPRLADSLKPVERRSLVILYENKSLPGTKPKKSGRISGDVMTLHPHGDISIYKTLCGLAQPFTNPIPLIQGFGNFGNDAHPEGSANYRYTEMTMSKYAKDCFFSDYDDECIEKIFNTSRGEDEPFSLPCKYPNLLINGGFGLAIGNEYCVPTYSIPDVVKLTKRLLQNPDADNIYMIPNSPTGCDIVDNGSLRTICDTGTGTWRMRSTITVEENPKKPNLWILRVHNLPWMVGIQGIKDKIAELTKAAILPVKDIEDRSQTVRMKNPNGGDFFRKRIQMDILINKAHDPNQIIAKLYKLTQLEKSIAVNFKVVADGLTIDRLNMRDLICTWIDNRREYLRRLVNKKIAKLSAKKAILEIMIVLTSKNNLEKTLKIIQSNTAEDAIEALMQNKDVHINSFQAEEIIEQKLRAFSKGSHEKYKEELEKVERELKENLKKTKGTKYIDETIEAQLDELLRYHTSDALKSRIVAATNSIEIPNTDHFVTITKLGMIKKLPYKDNMLTKKTPSLGVFKNQDYPVHGFKINNHDSLIMFDNFGRYSCIPVHTIESTEPSQFGSKVYDCARLNGEIVEAFEFFGKDLQDFVKEKMHAKISIVTLSKNGYLKKTPIENFTKSRNQKNIRAMRIREDDALICGKIIIEPENGADILIYTEKGSFAYIHSDNIAEQSKDSSGLLSINLLSDDACKGFTVIGKNDVDILVVTEKGMMKRCELEYLGQPGKRKVSSYLASLEQGDKICFVDTIEEDVDITVCTRTSYEIFQSNKIPVRARKSKCVKMVAVPLGNNIISVSVNKRVEN